MGGAHGDGCFEVTAHSHREQRCISLSRQLGKMGKKRPWRSTIGRDAHQPHDVQAMLIAAATHEADGFSGCHPGLLLFSADINLNKARERTPDTPHLAGESLGDAIAINRLDHIKQGHGIAGLVGLQRTGQVQLDIGKAGAQFWPLLLGLLHTIFPEQPLPGLKVRHHGFSAKGLGHGDELDFGGRRAKPVMGSLDPLADRQEGMGSVGIHAPGCSC